MALGAGFSYGSRPCPRTRRWWSSAAASSGCRPRWRWRRERRRRGRSCSRRSAALAAHQTGHNSGVIHSGIYYKPGSLKARFTVQGAREMVALRAGARHRLRRSAARWWWRPTPDELPRLDELHRRGTANGTPGLEMIGPERLREIEPHAAGLRGAACRVDRHHRLRRRGAGIRRHRPRARRRDPHRRARARHPPRRRRLGDRDQRRRRAHAAT